MNNQSYAKWLSNLSSISLEQERKNIQWVIDFGVAKVDASKKMEVIQSEIQKRIK